MQRTTGTLFILLALLLLAGCALPPGVKPDPADPFERLNRATFRFNDVVDRHVTKPIAVGYVKVTPRVVRTGVSNFLDNLAYPVTIINDLLQLKLKLFAQDTGRLVMNTTLGVGGILDPASKAGLQKNDEDFGLTLGRWGAKPGPYVVIPLLGPSDVRDATGRVADLFMDPRHYMTNTTLEWSLWALDVVDTRARLLDTEKLISDVYDRYAFLRNAYLQRRQFLIRGEQSNSKQQQQQYEEEQRILEESEGPDESGAGGAGTAPHKPPPPPNPAPPQTEDASPPPHAGLW
ncbi:MAG TPA: VacJ family lipoprotein [Steroidobacteraceae bacterium]